MTSAFRFRNGILFLLGVFLAAQGAAVFGALPPASTVPFRGKEDPFANAQGLEESKTKEAMKEAIKEKEAEDRADNTEKKKKGELERPAEMFPPEPDSEFQEFVARSTGKRLPVFGQNLFEIVPSTFAPLENVPVPADYVIGPGDELLIRVWGQLSLNERVVVGRNGSIYLAKIGEFSVAGLKYEQLHSFLNSEFSRIFKNYEFSVSLGQLRSIQIFMVGQVRRPGTYTVSSLSTLINALFVSGGPSKSGSMRRIQLKRDAKIVTTLDLYDLIQNGDKSRDASLLPGDVIYVPPVGPVVAIVGSVNIPAIYELKDHDTLKDAIVYAGGLNNTAAGEKAFVERIDVHRVRKVTEFALNEMELKNEMLDGDILRFQPVSPRFENAVTLRGNIAWPGRYPWRDGMRVKDLIPNHEFLITRDYWERQNLLVGHEKQPQKDNTDTNVVKNEVKRMSAEINWDYAVIERMDQQGLTSHLLPFNLAKAITGDENNNLVLQRNDILTIFSQADIEVPVDRQSKFVYLEGEFHVSGVYQVEPKETLRHLIQRVGGITPDAYLYGAAFTRESARIEQQKRLDDYIQNLEQSLERAGEQRTGIATSEEALATQQRVAAQHRLIEKLRQIKATGRLVLRVPAKASGIVSGAWNFGSSWMISYALLLFALADSMFDASPKSGARKRKIILYSILVVVIWFNLLRGHRTSLPFVIAAIFMYYIWGKGLLGSGKAKAGLRWWRILPVVLGVFIVAYLVGAVRSSLVDVHDISGMLNVFSNLTESGVIRFDNLITGTWSAVLLTPLSVAGDYVNGSLPFKYGKTYLDFLGSIVPGFIADWIGYTRPIDATHGPSWEMTFGQGGTHAVVVPFMNFGMAGVFMIVALWSFGLAKLERNVKQHITLANVALLGIVAMTAPHWLWYGEKNIITALVIWLLLSVLYKASSGRQRNPANSHFLARQGEARKTI
jgi:polysaccharide export outer membrane protein